MQLKKPLEGIKVIDLSRFISGPYCGMLLGDLGADVVKVEKRGVGDDSRHLPPYINGESLYSFVMNRSKRSLELDFRSEGGQCLLRRLIDEADVVIQNFRPGTMEKMGCGYADLQKRNPGIIMVNISGFGPDGPYKDRPGFDAAVQAMSGLMSITGEPEGMPMMYGTYSVDYATAMYASVSVCAALRAREITGEGQSIELSLLECAATLLMTGIPMQTEQGVTLSRVGNRDRYTAPGNCFMTSDGQAIMIIAGNQSQFERLVKAMGREDLLADPRFARQDVRYGYAEEIEQIVQEWVGGLTVSKLQELLDQYGIVAARVETLADVVENPQLRYRGKLMKLKHSVMGEVTMMGAPYDFSGMELDLSRAAPVLGEHTDEVLKQWTHMPDSEIEELRRRNII